MPDSTAAAEKFYVTTPIYYVNARPHIGHAYTTIVADVLARRHRLLGQPTFFLTGTDEHGQKIERSAAAAGIPPLEFADRVSQTFRDLWDRMGITYDDFIRTTEPRHAAGVQHLFRQLQNNGAIYKGTYTGQYCVSDEAYVDGPPGIHCPDCGRLTETVSEENYYFRLSRFQLPLLNLIESNTLRIEPESRRNEVLSFLKGPVYGAKTTVTGITHTGPGIIDISDRDISGSELEAAFEAQRPARTAAGTPFVPGALKDLSISRTSFSWGIPVPGDERHVVYVWLDALANYMTALGYPEGLLFQKFWPADLHLVGKEIIRFHCVYWPAFLLALDPNWATLATATDLPTPPAPALGFDPAWAAQWLPKSVVAHGWLLFEESKMSKSRGNIVRTETILAAFGDQYLQGIRDHNARELRKDPAFTPVPEPSERDRDLFATDVLRYFLLREIPFGQDGSFSFDAMVTRYNADLANGYGNLVSRTLAMVEQYEGFTAPDPTFSARLEDAFKQDQQVQEARAELVKQLNQFAALFGGEQLDRLLQDQDVLNIGRNLDLVFSLVKHTDGLLSATAPWKSLRNAAAHGLVIDSASDFAAAMQALQLILDHCRESIRILTALLHPILPFSTARVWAQLGLGSIEDAATRGELRNLQWGGLQPGTRLGPLAPIFPRADTSPDKGLARIMADHEQNTRPANLQNVANDERDAATPDHTAFREAPLASVASPATDTTAIAEARSEGGMGGSTSAPPDPGGLTSRPPSRAQGSTDPSAPPRTSSALVEAEPILQVGASSAPVPELPRTPSHVAAEPSGVFASSSAGTPVSAAAADASPQITIDDFAKVELRVARILTAERIPKADKLLRLEVDLGHEQRQILSGIALWYTPDELIGRRIIVVTNLAPRKMRGLDSHGMLLAASGPEDPANPASAKPILATVPEPIPLGTRLK